MKKKLLPTVLVSLCFLLAGIIFIAYSSSADVYTIVETVLGIVFIVPSILYVCLIMSRHRDQRDMADYVGIVPSLGGLCFGVVLVLKPELFNSALSIVFAVLLIVLGMAHLVYMAISSSRLKIAWWYYIAPLAIAVAGIVLLLKSDIRDQQPWMVLTVGVAFVLSAVAWGLELAAEWQAAHDPTRLAAGGVEPIDVTPEEVKD